MSQAATGRVMREVWNLVGEADRDGVPDGILLARFVDQRDESAFELLVRRYGRLVFGVCRRMLVDRHSAEDAFQATFLVLIHKAASLDRNRPLADWLYTVAFRLASRARVNLARLRAREAVAAQNRTGIHEPTVPDDGMAVVHEELNRLPAQHRVPLVLSYLEGRNYEQVARAIGCPIGSVGWRLARAKELLRERLTHRGVVCPATGVAALLASSIAGAAVNAPLIDTTVRAGRWFLGEPIAEAAPSAQALELARGVIGTMTTSKWTLVAGILLTIGLGGGTAWIARSMAMVEAPSAALARPAAVEPDAKADELPAGAVSRMGTSQFRHGEAVFFIFYTADGKSLITAGRDETVRMWDLKSGNELRQFKRAAGKKEPIDAKPPMPNAMMHGKIRAPSAGDFPVAVSPDGSMLAASRNRTITVWATASGKQLHELTASANVFELHFTPEGKTLVAADDDQAVTHWDPAGGKLQKTLAVNSQKEAAGTIRTGSAVSPAGTHLVQQLFETETGNGVLRIHDLVAGKAQPDIKLSAGGAQNIAFSANGQYLAWSSFTDGVTVWDVGAQKERCRFGGGMPMKPRLFGKSLRISDDGKTIAVTLANDAIELWDIAESRLIRSIGGYEAERSGRVAVRVVLGAGNRMTSSDLAFSPDGKTVAVSLGTATVRQFDTGTGKERPTTPGHLSGVMAAGSDGQNVVTVSRESIRVWNKSGDAVRSWDLAPPAVSVAISVDAKRIVTCSGNGVLKVWDVAKGAKILDIETNRTDVAGVSFSPDGKLLATKAELNSAVNLWDAATGKHIRTIGQDGEPVFSGGKVVLDLSGMQTPALAFSPDSRLIAAAGDKKQLCIWDVRTGNVVCEIPAPAQTHGIAFGFSPNGQVLAIALNNGTLLGIETATGEKRFETKLKGDAESRFRPGEMVGGVSTVNSLGRGNANAGSIAFTADGRFLLATVGRPVVHVLDVLTGLEVGQLEGHLGSVSTLRVASDGKLIVSGSVDTTALLWDSSRLARVEVTREVPIPVAEIETLWNDLAKSDAVAAYLATRKLLTDRTQTVAFLKQKLQPIPAVQDVRIEQLLNDLGGTFDVRRKAAAELERIGELAEPHIRKRLQEKPTLDMKQRLEGLLQKATTRKLSGEQLRELRSIELLELAATSEAKDVLKTLAGGAGGARLTREAEAALSRLVR